MVKFYFMKVITEVNPSGQTRKVVYPLPGQTTYNRTLEEVPVDTTMKIQLNLQENGKACRCRVNTILGVRVESDDLDGLRLYEHRRGEVRFYRTEETVYRVRIPNGIDAPNDIEDADIAMRQAYAELVGDAAPQSPSPERGRDQDCSLAFNYIGHLVDLAKVRSQRTNEVEVVKNTLLRNESETRALKKALAISQLIDRMGKGVVKFWFFKQNGERREALGTRNQALMDGVRENASSFSRGLSTPDGEHFNYFDVQRRGWRSFCIPDFDGLDEDFLVIHPDKVAELSFSQVAIS